MPPTLSSGSSGQLAGRLALAVAVTTILLSLQPHHGRLVTADDSAAAPAFDMGALASLASNIGSNPHIMSLVSNFLNANNGNQKQAVGAIGGTTSAQSDMGSVFEQDPNSIAQQSQAGGGEPPFRRGLRVAPLDQSQQQTQSQTGGQSQAAPSSSQSGSPLSGLISMLPGVLSSFSSSSGNGGGLASLLGSFTKPPPPPPPQQANAADQQQQPQLPPQVQGPQQQSQTIMPATQPQQAQVPATTSPGLAAQSMGPAQSVINQVLAAYLARQIPDELIQLGLSGRVPPQLIELALSGQVPSQIIQMIITGQVPMSTINAFLNAMQSSGAPSNQLAASSRSSNTLGNANQQIGTTTAFNPTPPPMGMFSTTRALFEAIFKRDSNGRPMINVPTLLGNIPIKIPTIPNVRSFGQMVGGTITNMASMMPF
jgi:hypothetical protein